MHKSTIIKKIKAIIEKHGTGGEYDKCITTADIEATSSPVYNIIGKTSQLVETFGQHKATVVTYKNDNEEDEDYLPYEGLAKGVLEEILSLLEDYEIDEDKLRGSCRD